MEKKPFIPRDQRGAALLATRLHPYRRVFLIVSLIGIALLGGALFLARSAFAAKLVMAAFGPFVLVPWVLLCLCSAFGPGSTLRDPSTSAFKKVWRWYFAVCLALFFVAACAWPFMVLLM